MAATRANLGQEAPESRLDRRVIGTIALTAPFEEAFIEVALESA
jgi:hypothetical protein